MYNYNRFKILNIVRIGVLVITAVVIIWFVTTHGFISTSMVTNEMPLIYVKTSQSQNQSVKNSASTKTILSSGRYSFSVPSEDGGLFISERDVPRFLLTSKLSPKPTSPLVKTMGRSAFSDLVRVSSGLASHQANTFRPVDKNNITNDNLGDTTDDAYPDFVQSVLVSSNTIGGMVKTSGGMQPVIYNTLTKNIRSMPLINDVATEQVSSRSDNGLFSSFTISTGEVNIYTDARTVSIKLANSDRVSKNEGNPIYSATAGRIAVATGSDFISTNDNKTESSSSSQTVKVFDSNSKQNLWEQTFTRNPVQNISLSPDGNHLAILTTTTTAIYNTSSNKPSFTIPYGSTKFMWVDNQSFVFTSQADGIFSGSIKSKTAQTIAPYSRIRPNNLSFVDSSKVYFTGYSSADDNTQNPAVFEADLNVAASKQSKAALQKFPHQGRGYYVDILDSTITIQTTRYVNSIPEQTNEFATSEDLARIASQGDYTIDTAAQAEGLRYATDELGGSLDGYTPRYTYVDLDF